MSTKERTLSLHRLTQRGDSPAVELFHFSVGALGVGVASLAMAIDPQFVVIGGAYDLAVLFGVTRLDPGPYVIVAV